VLNSRPVNHANGPRITFITGTDTGVGKTLLTALLLCHLRRTGRRALALKPFCSGTRADARLLHLLQNRELSLAELNPFFFPEAVAPMVAARKQRRSIRLEAVLDEIHRVASSLSPGDHLLIEGSGGLLVPLGPGYTVLDLVLALSCEVVVVARNRLGTINHSLLTVGALQRAGVKGLKLVLMGCGKPDSSARSNPKLLSELLAPVPVQGVPFLPSKARTAAALKPSAGRLQRALAALV
jgi:dethiobiotin synthetase